MARIECLLRPRWKREALSFMEGDYKNSRLERRKRGSFGLGGG
jgi:hypothetical protein